MLKTRRVHVELPLVFEPLVPVRTAARARYGEATGSRECGFEQGTMGEGVGKGRGEAQL